MGLPCMNCKKDVGSNDARLFAECFVCPECYAVAERMMTQGEQELRWLLLSLKELLRLAILKGELRLSAVPPTTTPDKKTTVVDAVVELARRQKEGESCPTLPSRNIGRSLKTNTELSVPTADGQPSSSCTLDAVSTSETSPTETLPTEPADV